MLQVFGNDLLSLRVVILFVVFDVSNQVKCDSVFLQRTHVLEFPQRDLVLLYDMESVFKQSKFCIVTLVFFEGISD